MNRTVILTADEALVLLYWLSRHEEPGVLPNAPEVPPLAIQ